MFTDELASARVLAILRTRGSTEHALRLVAAAVEGGLRIIEFPLTNPDALSQIEATRGRYPELVVGVGTVTTVADVVRSRSAGAQFAVTPGLDAAVTAAMLDGGMGYLPGVLTPTDIQAATAAGLDTLKLFPAGVFGPEYVKALAAPFPGVRLVPTGAIGCSKVGAYLDAGAHAVAIGGDLFASADESEVARRMRSVVVAVAERGVQ